MKMKSSTTHQSRPRKVGPRSASSEAHSARRGDGEQLPAPSGPREAMAAATDASAEGSRGVEEARQATHAPRPHILCTAVSDDCGGALAK
jgi:hypothetical protein